MKLTAFIVSFDSNSLCWRVYGYDSEGREVHHIKEYRSSEAAECAADWYQRGVMSIATDEWRYS